MNAEKKAALLEKYVLSLQECGHKLPYWVAQQLDDIAYALEEGDVEELEALVEVYTADGE